MKTKRLYTVFNRITKCHEVRHEEHEVNIILSMDCTLDFMWKIAMWSMLFQANCMFTQTSYVIISYQISPSNMKVVRGDKSNSSFWKEGPQTETSQENDQYRNNSPQRLHSLSDSRYYSSTIMIPSNGTAQAQISVLPLRDLMQSYTTLIYLYFLNSFLYFYLVLLCQRFP